MANTIVTILKTIALAISLSAIFTVENTLSPLYSWLLGFILLLILEIATGCIAQLSLITDGIGFLVVIW